MGGAEQRPGKPNGVNGRAWDSRISPKTPNSILAEPTAINLSSIIAADMIASARELAPTVNWDKVLVDHSFCDRRGRHIGKTAVEKGIAQNMRIITMQMGWGMSTPHVVYMSGLYFLRVIDKNTAEKSARIKTVSDLNKKVFSEEARAATIAREESEIAELSRSREALECSLKRFARKKVTRSKRDLKQLQEAVNLLFYGKVEQAETLLSSLPERKLKRRPEGKTKPAEVSPIPQERAITVFVANPQPVIA